MPGTTGRQELWHQRSSSPTPGPRAFSEDRPSPRGSLVRSASSKARASLMPSLEAQRSTNSLSASFDWKRTDGVVDCSGHFPMSIRGPISVYLASCVHQAMRSSSPGKQRDPGPAPPQQPPAAPAARPASVGNTTTSDPPMPQTHTVSSCVTNTPNTGSAPQHLQLSGSSCHEGLQAEPSSSPSSSTSVSVTHSDLQTESEGPSPRGCGAGSSLSTSLVASSPQAGPPQPHSPDSDRRSAQALQLLKVIQSISLAEIQAGALMTPEADSGSDWLPLSPFASPSPNAAITSAHRSPPWVSAPPWAPTTPTTAAATVAAAATPGARSDPPVGPSTLAIPARARSPVPSTARPGGEDHGARTPVPVVDLSTVSSSGSAKRFARSPSLSARSSCVFQPSGEGATPGVLAMMPPPVAHSAAASRNPSPSPAAAAAAKPFAGSASFTGHHSRPPALAAPAVAAALALPPRSHSSVLSGRPQGMCSGGVAAGGGGGGSGTLLRPQPPSSSSSSGTEQAGDGPQQHHSGPLQQLPARKIVAGAAALRHSASGAAPPSNQGEGNTCQQARHADQMGPNHLKAWEDGCAQQAGERHSASEAVVHHVASTIRAPTPPPTPARPGVTGAGPEPSAPTAPRPFVRHSSASGAYASRAEEPARPVTGTTRASGEWQRISVTAGGLAKAGSGVLATVKTSTDASPFAAGGTLVSRKSPAGVFGEAGERLSSSRGSRTAAAAAALVPSLQAQVVSGSSMSGSMVVRAFTRNTTRVEELIAEPDTELSCLEYTRTE